MNILQSPEAYARELALSYGAESALLLFKHAESEPMFTCVPQDWIDAVRADLTERAVHVASLRVQGWRWVVIDHQTMAPANRTKYKTHAGALRAADRLDNAYGGYRYHVRRAEA